MQKNENRATETQPYRFQSIAPFVRTREDILALQPDQAYTYFQVESAILKARNILAVIGERGAHGNMPNWAIAKILLALDYLTEQQQTSRLRLLTSSKANPTTAGGTQ